MIPETSRHLTDPVRRIELSERAAESWQHTLETNLRHTSQALAKLPSLRLVLITLHKGAHIADHRADADISIHCLTGQVTVGVAGEPIQLAAGQLVTVARGLIHDVSAAEDSLLLLALGGQRNQ